MLLGRVDVINSRSFIRVAMFDLALEQTVGGGEKGERFINISLLQKSKVAAIIFAKRILSIR